MPSDDTQYYVKRAADELELAQSSVDANVAAIHRELARQYAALVTYPELRSKLRIAI